MLGSLDHVTRQLMVHASPTKRSSDFIALLEQLDRLFGPQPGRQAKPVVLVEDNGPIHTANARSPPWPPAHTGSPSRGCRNTPPNSMKSSRSGAILTPITSPTRPSQTFNALDQAIHDAVIDLNRERIPDPLAIPTISA